MTSQKGNPHRLRNWYFLYFEVGFIFALLVVILAFQTDWSPKQKYQVNLQTQEIVEMEEIQQTKQESEPPPPPRPPAPVEAPNNAVIEQENINFDASLDLDAELDVSSQPPPPDQPEKEESKKEKEPEIFVAVEQEPDCGGLKSLQKKVQYPTFAEQAGIEGRVTVQFVVDEEGDVTNTTILRGAHKLLNEEAVRAVQQLDCTAGRQRGKPVKVRMTMPVTFRLESPPQ